MLESKMSSVLPGGIHSSKRSYITTGLPATHIYKYGKTYNAGKYTWNGSLTVVDMTVQPFIPYNAAGVVLKENGKKLYPGANPGIDRYMVGVFIDGLLPVDDDTPLPSLFIDPNCSVFAVFNGDKSAFLPRATDDHATPASADMGAPVYTVGDITTTQGNLLVDRGNIGVYGDIRTSDGDIIAAQGDIVAEVGNINAGTGSIAAAGSVSAGTFLSAERQLLLAPGRIVGRISMAGGIVDGSGFLHQQVFTNSISDSSYVFLTNTSQITPGTVHSVDNINNPPGTFEIVSSDPTDNSIINWMVIN
jgi:hypothetical protein